MSTWAEKLGGPVGDVVAERVRAALPAPPAESAPVDAAVPDVEALGAVAVDLAWNWTTWVNRRVETFRFVEDATVRRSMSVDFTLPPPDLLAAEIQRGWRIVVPLQILAKRPLMHVDVVDEQSNSLSTLSTERNADLSGRGLVRLLNVISAQAGGPPLSERTATQVSEMVRARRVEADAIRERLLADGEELAELLRYGTAQQRPETQLITELCAGFLQLVQVAYEPGVNRVIKAAYDVEQKWDEPASSAVLGRTLRGLGALPRRRTFGDLNIGQGLGFHVEVIAPEDTELLEGKLRGTQFSTETGADVVLTHDAQVGSRSRSHAYVRLRAGDEGEDDPLTLRNKRLRGRGDVARFTVAIAPRRAGILTVATFSAFFTAVTLLVFATRLSELDGQTSAAVLLLVPAIIAAYVARPGEHPFATRALIGVRAWALVGGGLAAILSAMIGAGFMKPVRAPASAAPSQEPVMTGHMRCTVTSRTVGSPASRWPVP